MWAGVLPFTSDLVPIIDEVGPGLIVAAGHVFGNAAGPFTGKLVSQLLTGEEPEIDLSECRWKRDLEPIAAGDVCSGDRRSGVDVTDEHERIRDTVRRFVDREVQPSVAERERAGEYRTTSCRRWPSSVSWACRSPPIVAGPSSTSWGTRSCSRSWRAAGRASPASSVAQQRLLADRPLRHG